MLACWKGSLGQLRPDLFATRIHNNTTNSNNANHNSNNGNANDNSMCNANNDSVNNPRREVGRCHKQREPCQGTPGGLAAAFRQASETGLGDGPGRETQIETLFRITQ